MAKRQRIWAEKQRDRLLEELGGRCEQCGTAHQLEFDVIIPTGNSDHHRKYDWSWRMSFYRREHDKGNLQILCKRHNAAKQNRMALTAELPIECPF